MGSSRLSRSTSSGSRPVATLRRRFSGARCRQTDSGLLRTLAMPDQHDPSSLSILVVFDVEKRGAGQHDSGRAEDMSSTQASADSPRAESDAKKGECARLRRRRAGDNASTRYPTPFVGYKVDTQFRARDKCRYAAIAAAVADHSRRSEGHQWAEAHGRRQRSPTATELAVLAVTSSA